MRVRCSNIDVFARNMRVSQSLAARALLAVVLMIGFYLLALGIAAALLWIPYAEYAYVGRVHIKIAAVCLGAAGTILWCLIPRADRFTPPGPLLRPSGSPQLFTLINDVARATSQEPPREVYLLNDVNAWVSHRGGVMGFGSRRVMGVGLPLLTGLSARELEAVIAHEFGHYCSGDVALGPWIYKTRAAIARTLVGVRETFLELPFNWYGRLFLKMTMAVSRRQEFIADETAARIAGPDAMARALRKVATLGPAYGSYFQNEVLPVLKSGFVPPIAEGFERFLANPDTRQVFEQFADAQTTGDRVAEFDTHPPLADRIAALGISPAATADVESQSGSVLMPEPDQQARTLLEHHFGADTMNQLKPIAWESVAEHVYTGTWTRMAQHYREWFGTLTTDGIPSGKPAYIQMGSRLVGKEEININSEERIERAVQLMTAGLGATLIRAGWRMETGPGQPLVAVRGEERLDPRKIVVRLVQEPESCREWKALCEAMGVAGLPLADQEAVGT
jgi:heat shock protein HtpX